MRTLVLGLFVIGAAGLCFGTGGYITGRVTNPEDSPVQNVYVSAQDYASGSHYDYDYSGPDGYYTIGPLPAGSYRLEVYVWNTNDYVYRQYYNGVIRYDEATPVTVLPGQTTSEIDFELQPAASIEGYVYDPLGSPVIDVEVDMYSSYFDFGRAATTDSNGYYLISGLPAGGVYIHSCRPFGYDDLQITARPIALPSPVLYSGQDFDLVGSALTVSGIVYDQATSLPVEGLYVGAWIEDLDTYGGHCQTDADGYYILKNLPPCEELDIWVNTHGTDYAQTGTEISVYDHVENMDFALTQGITVSLQVVDIATGAVLSNIEVSCDNEYYQSWNHAFTDSQGWARLDRVPGGFCEIVARPSVSSGYCWSYGWPEALVYVAGDQDMFSQIAVQRGTLVSGRFVDAASNPVGGIEFEWQGKTCAGWANAAPDGTFSLRLPLGTFSVGVDDDDDGFCYPVEIHITDIEEDIDLGDITVYDDSNCQFISGLVAAPSGWPEQGELLVVSFEPGTLINADTLPHLSVISETLIAHDGSFTLPVIPGGMFDLHLVLIDGIDGTGIETIIFQDSALAIATSTNGVAMTYLPHAGELTGMVHNTFGLPVTGHAVLTHSATGQLAGFCGTDEMGGFNLYNLPSGSFDLTISHAAYEKHSLAVTLLGSVLDVGTVTLTHHSDRYGNDLNGDGRINIEDMVLLAQDWLADYDLDDFANLSNSWLLKCFWFTD